AEPEPLWTTLVDRLRLAAAGEGNAGRARAALVYALAKSGDVPGALAELAKLDALVRPYPLSPALHALVEKTPTRGAADGGAEVPPSRAPAGVPAISPPAAGGPAAAPAGDVARAEGDTKGAIAGYKRAIGVNPSYLPALLGLADIQWASGDRAGATHGYGDIVDRFPEGTYPPYVRQRVKSPAPAPADTPKPAPTPTPGVDESSP